MHWKRLRVTGSLVVIVLLVMAGVCPLWANGGGYVKGLVSSGAFKPLGIEQVEMLTEKLDIDLHIEYADVSIEYVLHNPGPKVTVEAGFPSAVAVYPYGEVDEPMMTMKQVAAKLPLENFELKADGRPVKVTIQSDDLKLESVEQFPRISTDGEGGGITVKAWHVFKLDFEKGQTRRVTVRYRNPYFSTYDYVSDDMRLGPMTLTYLFSSAAAWAGPIKHGTVTVRSVTADMSKLEFSHPKRFMKDGDVWRWQFTDFEPTLEDDLVITLRPGGFGQAVITENTTTGETEWNHTSYMGWGAKMSFEEDSKMGGQWELRRQDFKATASSTLTPGKEFRYDAQLLAEDDPDTGSSAWVEGVKGDGLGESVTLTLDKPAKVRRIGLVNGYAKNEDIYRKNNRVSRFDVSVNGGAAFPVDVPDERLGSEMFYFDLPASAGDVSTVKLTIAGVYKGSKYQDTALSDVVLVVPLEKEPKIQPAR
ncbi:hypothetical protein DES53_101128 [Roseimicrobium gellanilyticum]|uniref:NAD glycohydrolase translocation F5/8 type C domain-containing protein n=1 Tax=Roseimicrobium gellanilyticum TaxID=748857 RepID=A0A366HST0_9BACT|nr:hypothetical protein [Roseimicrobium gellanilyticum]RBP47331.1 hypothetical protein DES53_101128 [Roseimicrobium gellanilyticum]